MSPERIRPGSARSKATQGAPQSPDPAATDPAATNPSATDPAAGDVEGGAPDSGGGWVPADPAGTGGGSAPGVPAAGAGRPVGEGVAPDGDDLNPVDRTDAKDGAGVRDTAFAPHVPPPSAPSPEAVVDEPATGTTGAGDLAPDVDGEPGKAEAAGEPGDDAPAGRRPVEVALPTWDEPAPPLPPRRGRATYRSGSGGAPATSPAPRAVRGGFFARLYHGETNLEFVGRRRTWFTISSIVILAGIISLGARGLNLDIEFVGGTSWTVQWPAANITQARDAVAPFNLSGSTITILGQSGGKSRSLQVEAKIPKGQSAAQTQDQLVKVEDSLAHLAHVRTSEVSITSVGPSWGGEVTKKAIEALVVFFILVALYISVFFEWRMALSAIIAVIHDILVVVGIYSLTGFDVTPDTVVAILTILGYSLYDTIVVFDRIRDNLKGVGAGGRLTISDVVNLSMNQTLARSINTSLVAILPIFAVLILGAEILGATTLQYFGWALLIGLASGAYSSIFIASPIVAMLKEREPRWRRIRERLGVRGTDALVLSPAALAAGLFGGEGASGSGRSRASAAARAGSAGRGDPDEQGREQADGAVREDTGPSRAGVRAAGARPPASRPGGSRTGGRTAGRPSGGARRKGGRR